MAEIEPRRAELALPLVRRGIDRSDSASEESVEDKAGHNQEDIDLLPQTSQVPCFSNGSQKNGCNSLRTPAKSWQESQPFLVKVAGCFSLLTFSWVGPLISLGYHREQRRLRNSEEEQAALTEAELLFLRQAWTNGNMEIPPKWMATKCFDRFCMVLCLCFFDVFGSVDVHFFGMFGRHFRTMRLEVWAKQLIVPGNRWALFDGFIGHLIMTYCLYTIYHNTTVLLGWCGCL